MKKQILILPIFALLVVSSLIMVSATTIIAGKIYDSTDSTYPVVAGADVIVTCNEVIKNTSSLSDGTYSVNYPEIGVGSCNNGNTLVVSATKGSLTGSNSGIIHDDMVLDLDIGIVNVALVPEFGLFVGALTIMGAVGVFFFVRRQ